VPINPIPTTPIIVDETRSLTPLYQAFFSSIHDWLGPVGLSGTTAQRPVNTPQNRLYVGQMYFDASLGVPVFVRSLNPTVWVNAAGAVV
jgi:hypothetical protein